MELETRIVLEGHLGKKGDGKRELLLKPGRLERKTGCKTEFGGTFC